MKILFLGDVVGRSGRDAIAAHLPTLRERFAPDAVVVNAENAAAGFGLTLKIAQDFLDMGVACLTLGNHTWDQREMLSAINLEPRIIRPANYPDGTPGKGIFAHTLPDGRRLVVVNLLARLFVEPSLDDPFAEMETILKTNRIGPKAAILVDFHGEATSEKAAFGHAFAGRVSAVVGTHTHVPTADAMILDGGTAYMTDVGMCGDYGGVIGMKKEMPIWRFTRKIPADRLTPGEGEGTVCGALIETDDATGLAVSIAPVRIGGRLIPTL